MYYFMLLREAAQYQFCSLHNYCSKGMQISKGLLDIRFTSNWHKIDIKRAELSRFQVIFDKVSIDLISLIFVAALFLLVRFPRPTPRRWVGGPMSRKGGN